MPVNSWTVEEEDDYDMERWTPSSKIANKAGSSALGWDELACKLFDIKWAAPSARAIH